MTELGHLARLQRDDAETRHPALPSSRTVFGSDPAPSTTCNSNVCGVSTSGLTPGRQGPPGSVISYSATQVEACRPSQTAVAHTAFTGYAQTPGELAHKNTWLEQHGNSQHPMATENGMKFDNIWLFCRVSEQLSRTVQFEQHT